MVNTFGHSGLFGWSEPGSPRSLKICVPLGCPYGCRQPLSLPFFVQRFRLTTHQNRDTLLTRHKKPQKCLKSLRLEAAARET